MTDNDILRLKKGLRIVEDFPKAGVQFIDITTLLEDGELFKLVVDWMQEVAAGLDFTKIVAIESRGFIFGAALASVTGKGLVLARKPKKLPADTISTSYGLEYGSDSLEMHRSAIAKGERVILVDDLLATGGSLLAAADLVEQLGGVVAGALLPLELSNFEGIGRVKRRGISLYTLIGFPFFNVTE